MPAETFEIPRLANLQDCMDRPLEDKIRDLPEGFNLEAPATITVMDLAPDANLSHPFVYGVEQPGYGPEYFIHDWPLAE